jgi:hypothetical protein
MELWIARGGREGALRKSFCICGGRTLEAIESICDAEDDLPVDVLDGLASLVDKSLLEQQAGTAPPPN